MMTNKILARFYIAIIGGVLAFGISQKYLSVNAYYLNGDEISQTDYDNYKKLYYKSIATQANHGIYLYEKRSPDYTNSLLYACIVTFVIGSSLLLPTAIRKKS
jgi:hypothetical protein